MIEELPTTSESKKNQDIVEDSEAAGLDPIKPYKELIFQSRAILDQIRTTEGHFISLASVREKRNGVNELQDEGYIQYGTQHNNDGYRLTARGKQALGW